MYLVYVPAQPHSTASTLEDSYYRTTTGHTSTNKGNSQYHLNYETALELVHTFSLNFDYFRYKINMSH
jgi:hypothetical protein